MFNFLKRFFKKKQPKKLTQFYREYADWLEGGCEPHTVFRTYSGLCSSIRRWDGLNYDGVYREMKKQFSDAGLCDRYPFNTQKSYSIEANTSTTHLNEKRRQWVFDHTK